MHENVESFEFVREDRSRLNVIFVWSISLSHSESDKLGYVPERCDLQWFLHDCMALSIWLFYVCRDLLIDS